MAINPLVVSTARKGWRWQWEKLMNGLAPSDREGNYKRPPSQHKNAVIPLKEDLVNRPCEFLPGLIIGRSCPWAHRTWLVYKIRKLNDTLNLHIAHANHKTGQWELNPGWLNCNSVQEIYKKCDSLLTNRATVPALIDPGKSFLDKATLLGNESAQLVEALNIWPSKNEVNLAPNHLIKEIKYWNNLLQDNVNNGVYKCGFARNQKSYEEASNKLFETLTIVDKHLNKKGPWLCGEELTIADICLFPTLIRWESVYEPFFKCSKKPLWLYPNICSWRQKLIAINEIYETCDSAKWRKDYYGALFPLNPSNIIPNGPDIMTITNFNIQNQND